MENWNSYYSNLEEHEGDSNKNLPSKSEYVTLPREQLQAILDHISVATSIMAKQGICIKRVNENLLSAEAELCKCLQI